MATTPAAEQTGLAKAAPQTPGVITTAEQYRAELAQWQRNYNVLTPFTSVSGIAPSFGLIASVVKINTDRGAGETYSGFTETGTKAMPFLKGEKDKPSEELALAKIGLRKLAECGGISTATTRTDPRTIPNYWEFKATATYRGLDGSLVTREATFEWDLRAGSDRLKGWTPNQITEGRKNGLRNCEARAINAAIRECGCGIKQKYTRAELEKPFLVVRVAFQPDMQDPAIKEMVTRQALGGASALYPATAARELPTMDAEVINADPRPVGSGTTAAAAPALPEGFGFIQKIEKTEMRRRDNSGTFSKWSVIDHAGEPHVTIKRELGEKLQRCYDGKIAIDITSEENSYQENEISEIYEHDPAQPSLPNLNGGV